MKFEPFIIIFATIIQGLKLINYSRKYGKKIAFLVFFFIFIPDQKNQSVIIEQYGNNSRQFWKRGVDDKQEYFTLMNNETKTYMTANPSDPTGEFVKKTTM